MHKENFELLFFQVSSLFSKGISAAYVSEQPGNERKKEGVSKGMYQLVFFTPELIVTSKRWRKVLEGELYADRLKAVVIDEAHCVKKW